MIHQGIHDLVLNRTNVELFSERFKIIGSLGWLISIEYSALELQNQISSFSDFFMY